MVRLLQYQLKLKGWMIIASSILCTTILGLINIQLNYDTVNEMTSSGNLPVAVVYACIPISAALVEAFYGLLLALGIYFIVAAMGKGYDIKLCYRPAFRILICLPLITAIDMLGFLIAGMKFSDFGFLGKLCYIPFYVLVFLNSFSLIPRYVNLSKKESFIMSSILTVMMVIIS